MAYKPVSAIEVSLWGEVVGAVALDPQIGYYAFEYNPESKWTHQHLMSVNGKFTGVLRDDIMEVADRFTIGTAKKVLDEVEDVVLSWPDFAKKAKVGPSEIQMVTSHHKLMELK